MGSPAPRMCPGLAACLPSVLVALCSRGEPPQVHPVAMSDTPGEAQLKSDCLEDCSLRVFKHDQIVSRVMSQDLAVAHSRVAAGMLSAA